jgi:hypothetical protein
VKLNLILKSKRTTSIFVLAVILVSGLVGVLPISFAHSNAVSQTGASSFGVFASVQLSLGAPLVVSVSDLPNLQVNSAAQIPSMPGPSGVFSSSSSNGLGTQSASSSNVTVLSKIKGLTETQGGLTPPDVQATVGNTTVIEAINAAAEIWYKNGTEIKEFTLASFLKTSAFIGDPRVLYDAGSGHFFMSVPAFDQNLIYLAVSATSSANGKWYIYKFTTDTSAQLTDQPTMGVSGDKVGISANIYTSGGVYSGIYLFNKAQLVNGTKKATLIKEKSSDFSVHPAHNYDSDNTLYFVSVQAGGVSSADFFRVTGVPGVTKIHIHVTTLSIKFAAEPPGAPQKGSSSLINTDDGRMQDAASYANTLWFTFEDGCVPKGGSEVSCIRLAEINLTTSKIVQDFDVATKGMWYYYPALSYTANGGIIVVFGFSNSKTYPSIGLTGQSAGSPAKTWSPPITAFAGKSYDNDGRYGDYFAATMDPVNPSVVWVAGQYESAPSQWATEILSTSFA